MALLTPLLLLMLLGVADFARVFYVSTTVTHAARAGAQYGAQSNGTAGDSANIVQAAAQEAQDLRAISITTQRFCTCSNGTAVDCITGTCPGEAPQLYVSVTANKVFKTLMPYPGIPNSVVLTRQAVLRVQ